MNSSRRERTRSRRVFFRPAMTSISKPITRRTIKPFMHYRRRLVVTLLPGDLLAIRLERDHKARCVFMPIADIYRQLVTRRALTEARERAKARRRKRK